MESIPKKGYFAKELALRTLFGDKAFADLKKLMDPCCGIGIDNICTSPCSSPEGTLSFRYSIECTQNPREYLIKVYAKSSIALENQIALAVTSINSNMYPLFGLMYYLFQIFYLM